MTRPVIFGYFNGMHQEVIGALPILPSEPRVVATVVFRPSTGLEMWAESFRQTLVLVPHD